MNDTETIEAIHSSTPRPAGDGPREHSSSLIAEWMCEPGGAPARRPRALLVGDTMGMEFATAIAELHAATHVAAVLTIRAALGEISTGEIWPDWVILCAGRPGEFAAEEVEQLRDAAPLARLVGLLGSWCEGETRTGKPWPAVPRIYAHQWANWLADELAAFAAGEIGSLALPITATDEERLLHRHSRSGRPSFAALQIAIQSPERAMAACMADACRDFGAVPLLLADRGQWRDAKLGIWDISTPSPEEYAALRGASKQSPGIRWIVLASFPRAEDRQQAIDCGACDVVSKPLLLDELRAALEKAAR